MEVSGGVSCVCTVAALLGAVSVAVVSLINHEQPEPYMDEVFHVPQAQSYCAGNYTHWDPMITTLPGLYILSVLWVEPVARLLSLLPSEVCTTANLRFQNAVFIVLNFLVLCWLAKKLHKSITTSGSILTALSLSTLPVLYFSSLIYYTDAGGVFFVLSAYSLSLSNHHLPAAILSGVAVLFRQTSVAWVVFIAGSSFIGSLEQIMTSQRRKITLVSLLFSLPSLFPSLIPIFLSLWMYVLVGVAFVCFVVWNGSVAIGDKTHHQPHLHLPQIFYFLLFSAFFSSPYLPGSVDTVKRFLRDLKRNRWILAGLCTVVFSLISVHFFTYVHPYILADNRHYPFYIWQRIFQRHETVKYLLTPVYSLIAVLFIHRLSTKYSQLWILLFFITSSLVLVPQQLLEFRYFIIPHILLRLHLPPPLSPHSLSLPLETGLSVCVNVATISIFLYRPFLWDNSSTLQRFMW